jgi:flagellar protein FlgJ
MSIFSQAGAIYTDLSGLDQLKYKLKGNSVADLRVAAQQFEALFIQQMMKAMRETKLAEGAFDSKEGDFYAEMLDNQLSLELSQGKGLGLADTIVKQMSYALNMEPRQSAADQAQSKTSQPGRPLPANAK